MSTEPTDPEASVRSIAQIEADLQRTREEMAVTVNELAGRLDPKTLAKDAAEQAKEKASDLSEAAVEKARAFAFTASEFASTASAKAKETIEDAKSGDSQALAYLAGAAAGVASLIAILARRHKR